MSERTYLLAANDSGTIWLYEMTRRTAADVMYSQTDAAGSEHWSTRQSKTHESPAEWWAGMLADVLLGKLKCVKWSGPNNYPTVAEARALLEGE